MPFPFKSWRQQERFPDFLWLLVFTGLALLLYTVNLGGPSLRDWDEGTVAQVAREIWRADGWEGFLHPTLFGQPYANKPTLMHGLVAISYHFFGVNEFAARLPGALLSAAGVPLIYWVQRQLHPTRIPVVMGTMVYLAGLPVVRHGRMAMLDGAILCFALGMVGCGLRSRRDTRWALGIGLGIGLMCLTKGILGLLLGGLLLAFLAWDTPRLMRSPYLWTGLILGLAPAVGWYVNQFVVQSDGFIKTSLLDQTLRRIWQPVENHRGSPFYYLLELLEWAWPWLLFWPWGLRRAWQQQDFSWGKFVLVWTVGFLTAITLMQTKLPWYVMPLYPALAIAIGPVLADAWNRCGGVGAMPFTPGPLPKIWLGGVGLLSGVAIAGFIYFSFFAEDATGDYRLPLGAIALGSLLCLSLMLRRDGMFIPVLGWTWYVAIFLLMASPHWVFELNGWPGAKPMGEMVRRVPAGEAVFTTDWVERPAVSFYGDRRVTPLCSVPPAELGGEAYVLIMPEEAERLEGRAIATTADWQLVKTLPMPLRRGC